MKGIDDDFSQRDILKLFNSHNARNLPQGVQSFTERKPESITENAFLNLHLGSVDFSLDQMNDCYL